MSGKNVWGRIGMIYKKMNPVSDEMTVREEFIEKVVDTMQELRMEAATQGEVALLYYMLKLANELME